jgi:hypothetical protein
MRSCPHLLLLCILSGVIPSFASTQIYRYTDDAGTLTYTTELQKIPEQYRGRAVPLYGETTGTAGTVAPVPAQVPSQPAAQTITVGSDYRMGAHDTQTDALRMAIDSAKRQALEQAATYLESVSEVRNFDLTRDQLRTYSGGIITVIEQRTSTKTEGGATVIHVDLTAQVDRNEVIQAITALRDNESATQQLVSLRAETDELRQRLDAANQALAAAQSAEQIQALANERRKLLDQMQADSLVSQAWTQVVYAYPGFAFRQGPPPHGSLPPSPLSPPMTAGVPDVIQQRLPPLPAPLSPSPLAAPLLQPTFPQIQPQGVPHGSLPQSPTPSLSPAPLTAPPVQPTFPQIQPQGVPHGSLSQSPATPVFPQIQPQGVPYGWLSPAPSHGHQSGETGGPLFGGSHSGGHGH